MPRQMKALSSDQAYKLRDQLELQCASAKQDVNVILLVF